MEALKPHSLISIWFNPRKTIRYLTHYSVTIIPRSHHCWIGLYLLYSIELVDAANELDQEGYRFILDDAKKLGSHEKARWILMEKRCDRWK